MNKCDNFTEQTVSTPNNSKFGRNSQRLPISNKINGEKYNIKKWKENRKDPNGYVIWVQSPLICNEHDYNTFGVYMLTRKTDKCVNEGQSGTTKPINYACMDSNVNTKQTLWKFRGQLLKYRP